jgi:hypothetical protein
MNIAKLPRHDTLEGTVQQRHNFRHLCLINPGGPVGFLMVFYVVLNRLLVLAKCWQQGLSLKGIRKGLQKMNAA